MSGFPTPLKVQDVLGHERIPPELWCEIFEKTLPHTRRVNGHDIPAAPWYLGLVCRRWRESALSFTHLWTTFHIDATILEGRKHFLAEIYPRAALQTQLLRSANVPLTLTFRWLTLYPAERRQLVALLDALVVHSHRWETVRISSDDSDDEMLRALSPIRGNLPLLRHLEFLRTGRLYAAVNRCNYFAAAPELRQVILTDEEFQYRSAVNLTDCGLASIDLVGEDNDLAIVVLPHVERLHLSDTVMVRLLTAPRLQHLFLKSDATGIATFLSRSGCQLTALSFQQCRSWKLIPVLEITPTLTVLHIGIELRTRPADLGMLLTALTASETSRMLCPNLADFRLVLDAALAEDYDRILEMLASQWHMRPACALAYVRVIDSNNLFAPVAVPAGFQALRDEGLDVGVRHDITTASYIPALFRI
ncbi:hypothetical protein C8R43DRAFT_1119068 [Mycena crocata]|nr:hypothetical protein C8R43DRAFT_1119068 [Mycena crocata]